MPQVERPKEPFTNPAFRQRQSRVRATQSLVSHMSFCWSHPSLVLLEMAWRWLFGIPFLWIVSGHARQILTQVPPSSTGLDRVDLQNPWLTSVLLVEAVARYQTPVEHVLRWLLPIGVLTWGVVSGLGRQLVLRRMLAVDGILRSNSKSLLKELPGYAVLQALWMIALIGCFQLWYRAMGWAAANYITVGAQPDLVGYLCWLIFISLGLYTLWALLSWTLAFAPVLLVLGSNERSIRPGATLRALIQSFTPSKNPSGKLLEVNLVLAIVRIMLIVLAMVFSAAPLPFEDQFGPDALHVLYVIIFIAFLVASDFFHVVRLRSFVDLWRHHRRAGVAAIIES